MSLNILYKRWITLALFVCFVLTIPAAHAVANIAVSFEPTSFQGGKLYLAKHITHFVTDSSIPDESIVSGAYDNQFTPPTNAYLIQSKDNWYRFTIKNTNAEDGHWILALDSALLEEVELITIEKSGELTRQHTGLNYSYEGRILPYNTFVLPIYQTGGTTQTYYLKVSTPFQMYFSPTLTDHAAFLKDAGVNFSFPHLFIGLLMGVFVYLLVLSLGSSSELMIHRYVWFVLFAMLIILYVDGFLMRYIPNNSWLVTRLWLLLHIGLQLSYLRTTQSYFRTRENYPFIEKYFSVSTVIVFSFLGLLLIIPYGILVKIELWYAAQLVIAMTGISCYIWIREKSKVQLFVIGNIGLLAMAALSTFAALGSLAANDWFVKHGYELGFCWQAIFFTWALSLKINDLATTTLAAKAESKAKSEFIAKMSHEIRTPMNGVLGMTQLLHATPVNDEQKHYLNVIESSGKTLLAVINDILDYSKLIAGKTELVPHHFNLEQMLAELNTLFGDVAHGKKIFFTIVVTPNTPLNLFGDSIRLRQILTNLLSNAFKFTDHGLVILKVKPLIPDRVTDTSATAPVTIQFSVQDTGIGITEEDQKNLFQTFTQVDVGSTRRHRGAGLGLSICKQFVEMMGGNIFLNSHSGEGAEFIFTVKMQVASAVGASSKLESRLEATAERPLNILVAEDDGINRDVLAGFLKKMGCHADFVFNGKEAVSRVNNTDLHYDLVLMDCEMPIMDGMMACRTIRQIEKTNKQAPIPIIALTAHTSSAYLKRCIDEGMTECLCKPISYEQLRALVVKLTALRLTV